MSVVLALLLVFGNADLHGQEDSVTLMLGGDIMLGNWVTDHLDRDGMDYPFRLLQPLLEKGDIRFCNFEMPIGKADSTNRTDKKYTFTLPPQYLEALNYGRLDIVSLANNHILDYGHTLADSTLQYLHDLGIVTIGYGKDASVAAKPGILERNGIKTGFLAYSMTFPRDFWATDSTAGTAYPDKEHFIKSVKELDNKADFIVISFHWGGENSDSTKAYQQVFAHRAIDAGADLIVGHHPHVWQGLEIYHHRLIAYSLGNLCFGSFSPAAKQSGLLEVHATKDSILSAHIHPLDVENVKVRFQPHILSAEESLKFFGELNRYSARFDSISSVSVRKDGKIIW